MFDLYIKQVIIMVTLFSGIPLICSSIVGLVVSVLQAATQIQEQSIGFTIKILSTILVMVAVSRWIGRELVNFFQQVLSSVSSLGGM